jgi:hypothetical protein
VYFRPVLCTIAPQSPEAVAAAAQNPCQSRTPSMIASTPDNEETPRSIVILPYIQGGVRYVLGPADLTTVDVASAQPESAPGGYQVLLRLTSTGIHKFDQVAATRYSYYKQDPSNPPLQSREAIEQGHTVLMAPAVEAPTFNGTIVFSRFVMNRQEAEGLALLINRIIAYDRAHAVAQT